MLLLLFLRLARAGLAAKTALFHFAVSLAALARLRQPPHVLQPTSAYVLPSMTATCLAIANRPTLPPTTPRPA